MSFKDKKRLDELIAKAKQRHQESVDKPIDVEAEIKAGNNHHEVALLPVIKSETEHHIQPEIKDFIWNEKQQAAIDLALTGKSFVLVGAAGTGKTTVQREITKRMLDKGMLGSLHDSTKYLQSGTPGIAIMAYTRRAVNNIRHKVDTDFKGNCLTAHKLLEYQPTFYDVVDPITGKEKKSMRFIPTRTRYNLLPSSLTTIVLEEGSMFGTDLYDLVIDALPYRGGNIQFIFLGDIQQLPPIYSSAILGFKMLELPVIELTEVYRQALESPIIRLAHRVLSGKPIFEREFSEWQFPGALKITPWKQSIEDYEATRTIEAVFNKKINEGDSKEYNPETDMILIPTNVGFGSIELNKSIAQTLGNKRSATVWEVIAGYNKHYLAVGDKMMYDKEDAVITNIVRNANYVGKTAQKESTTLDRWGLEQSGRKHEETEEDRLFTLEQAEKFFNVDIDNIEEVSDRKNQASHRITLEFIANGESFEIDTAAEVNALLFGYVLTVHKAQGCEWDKVFFLLHRKHNGMINRELMYTAITRAKKELHIICEKNHLVKGILTQTIKGDTLKEKAEYFKGKSKQLEEKRKGKGE